jgi:hypothetical protein
MTARSSVRSLVVLLRLDLSRIVRRLAYPGVFRDEGGRKNKEAHKH